MEIKHSLLADFANVTPDGRINMLGVFERINAFQVPFQVPSMSLIMMLTASPGEKGRMFPFKVMIVDEDGKAVAPPAELNLQVPDNLPGPDVQMNAILGMNGIVFSKFGQYRVDITIDGQSKSQISFTVNSMPRPQLPESNLPN